MILNWIFSDALVAGHVQDGDLEAVLARLQHHGVEEDRGGDDLTVERDDLLSDTGRGVLCRDLCSAHVGHGELLPVTDALNDHRG